MTTCRGRHASGHAAHGPLHRRFRSRRPAHNYLAFAGGSGITPVLSLIRSVLAREPKSRFTLVYANRRVNTIMFREEIEDLKNLHMGRLA
jgi:ring-1,2-phenylacetyl-CoA epoxidase subunit PaaE